MQPSDHHQVQVLIILKGAHEIDDEGMSDRFQELLFRLDVLDLFQVYDL